MEYTITFNEYSEDSSGNLFKSGRKGVVDGTCAEGWYTEHLVNMGADVTATNISARLVEATKILFREGITKIKYNK